ncbi:hypothetical protein DFJ74DRAFT_640813 [Hyaloraphidium curvatum]|nr:hypothetical protein DFJ74DRAFT_640813 [Hyaloraphidium curvatum]
MRVLRRLLAAAALIALVCAAPIAARSPPVRTRLRTAWPAPHVLLEALEYVASQNASAFFPMLGAAVAATPLPAGTEDLADLAVAIAEDNALLATGGAVALFRMSLALHTHAPAVQAYYHLYATTVVPALNASKAGFDASCSFWVAWQGRQHCSVDAFRQAAKGRASASAADSIYSFDHTIPPAAAKPGVAPVVVYADVLAPGFAEFHAAAVAAAGDLGATYVLRYRPPADHAAGEPLLLSGYGVELWIKKTDYKVIDDRKVVFPGGDSEADLEAEGGEHDGATEEELDRIDEAPVIMKLEEDQIAFLGHHAAGYILTSPDPLWSLVYVSQNFPRLAHLLVDRPPPADASMEILQTQQATKVQPGFSGLWINGLDVGTDQTNLFELLRFLRAEARVIDQITSLGFGARGALDLLNTKVGGAKSGVPWGDSYDTRDPAGAVVWLNDLEKDRRYASWPKNLRELLRPGFPNQFKFLRRNLFSLVALTDLANPDHLDVLATLFIWIGREIPMRFGFVPILNGGLESESARGGLFARFLASTFGLKDVRDFALKIRERITDDVTLPKGAVNDVIRAYFESLAGRQPKAGVEYVPGSADEAILSASTSYGDTLRAYVRRLGVSPKDGAWFLNGRHGEIGEQWQDDVVETYFRQLEHLQRKLYHGEIDDSVVPLDYFSTVPGVLPRRNPYISTPTAANPARFAELDALDLDVPYLSAVKDGDVFPGITVWLVADFSSQESWSLLSSALHYLIEEPKVSCRLTIVHAVAGQAPTAVPVVRLFRHAAQQQTAGHDAKAALRALLDAILLSNVKGQPKKEYFVQNAHLLEGLMEADQVPGLLQPLQDANGAELRSSLGLGAGQSAIVVNGRVFGPFPSGFDLDKDDFDLAVSTVYMTGVQGIMEKVSSVLTEDSDNAKSDAVLRLTAILGKGESAKELESGFQSAAKSRLGVVPVAVPGTHSQFSVGDEENAIFHVYAVLDPLTNMAQRISAVLEVSGVHIGRQSLLQLDGLIHITVRLNPTRDLKDLPIKRFYRFVAPKDLNPQAATATFAKLPEDTLLSLDLDVPNAWLAMPVSSVHDLDNIKLADLPPSERSKGIESVFELTKVLVEGHCIDSKSRQPPRGLQFILGSASYPNMVDTIVMANLGYFQLKAGPGVWELRLREGRSRRYYDVNLVTEDVREFSRFAGDKILSVASVTVRSFEGLTLFVKVSKKPGMEKAQLLDEDLASKDDEGEGNTGGAFGAGLWASIKKGLGLDRGGDREPSDRAASNETTINVFSVASGHLYERFMSIMFIGVMRHTKSPVKFWLIENFMSPTFKDFLPHLAKEYNFQYELVTYKWPHWLRAQTEKQRTIWGYKILFLDVLFPLSLDRVIFVDADQIVRTDLKELMEMDIGGAPYAYTPFCDSRQETEGYRFWKNGYWLNHLNGKPYHISALYLVDLARFRQMAAGDRLRGQYQMLSADPESLANLDQDLPNNLIHQVPIFSLPQEWLWCETWCDDESLKTAKTIDLCNNPMTKEPKLDRAKRQIPEWSVYDNEVAAVAARVAESRRNASQAGGAPRRDEL